MSVITHLLASLVIAASVLGTSAPSVRADSYLGLGGGSGPRLEFRNGSENRRFERGNRQRMERGRRDGRRLERERPRRDFFREERRGGREFRGERRRDRGGWR